MAKKYLSLERLSEYDALIKAEIDSGDSSALSSSKSYTDSEISKIKSGSIVVENANHATSADSAETAGSSTKATQDGNGKVIHETYETKVDAQTKLDTAKSYTDQEVAKKANSSHSHDVATTSANGFMSSAMVTKLSGIAEGANKITIDSSLSTTSTNPVQNKVVNTALSGKVPTTRKINNKVLSADITLSASDVGADASGSASGALTSAKAYTDEKIDAIVGTGASTTLDTIGEISAALKDNAGIIDTLASKTSLDTHTANTTVHITATERTNWNAAKTHADSAHAPSNAEKNQNAFSNIVVGSTTIAADTATDSLTLAGSNVTITPDANSDKVTIGITKANVEAALGFTPQTSGSYAAASHTHDDMYYTEGEIDTKVSEINASIENIISGTTMVAKANHSLTSDSATTANSAEKATMDDVGNSIKETYETKADAISKLGEAKSYADGVKNELLNGAGDAYDTLKELGDLIDDNHDAIDALEIVATGKSDKGHIHTIGDVTDLQSALDSKASTNIATSSSNGLMSHIDKEKLDGIEYGAKKVYIQNDEPVDVIDGSVWIDTDASEYDYGSLSFDGTTLKNYIDNISESAQNSANLALGYKNDAEALVSETVKVTELLDYIYPVGSLYWSTVSTSPESILGGTWERIKDRFLLAAGDTYIAGSEGGEATHVLSEEEMPEHKHDVYGANGWDANTSPIKLSFQEDGNAVIYDSSGAVKWTSSTNSSATKKFRSVQIGEDGESGETGASQPHNNMPPYLTAYCWKRTA